MRRTLLTTLAATAAAAFALPAAAQLSRNSDAPVDMAADNSEWQQCTSVWRGAAEALQDTSRLRADVLKARFATKPGGGQGPSGNCGDLVGMDAQGAVYYVTPEQRVRADAATYDVSTDTIVLTGDVIMVQGQNVLRGTRAVINTKTGEGQMQGQSTGRNKSGRVRGVFYPDKSDGKKK